MRPAIVLCGSVLLLAGCFTTSGDFKKDAQDFILGNQGLRDATGATFTTATCQEPERRDIGTTFACTAVDDQARSWEFSVEITGSNEYTVNVSRFP